MLLTFLSTKDSPFLYFELDIEGTVDENVLRNKIVESHPSLKEFEIVFQRESSARYYLDIKSNCLQQVNLKIIVNFGNIAQIMHKQTFFSDFTNHSTLKHYISSKYPNFNEFKPQFFRNRAYLSGNFSNTLKDDDEVVIFIPSLSLKYGERNTFFPKDIDADLLFNHIKSLTSDQVTGAYAKVKLSPKIIKYLKENLDVIEIENDVRNRHITVIYGQKKYEFDIEQSTIFAVFENLVKEKIPGLKSIPIVFKTCDGEIVNKDNFYNKEDPFRIYQDNTHSSSSKYPINGSPPRIEHEGKNHVSKSPHVDIKPHNDSSSKQKDEDSILSESKSIDPNQPSKSIDSQSNIQNEPKVENPSSNPLINDSKPQNDSSSKPKAQDPPKPEIKKTDTNQTQPPEPIRVPSSGMNVPTASPKRDNNLSGETNEFRSKISEMIDMGFPEDICIEALKKFNGNAERATDSIITSLSSNSKSNIQNEPKVENPSSNPLINDSKPQNDSSSKPKAQDPPKPEIKKTDTNQTQPPEPIRVPSSGMNVPTASPKRDNNLSGETNEFRSKISEMIDMGFPEDICIEALKKFNGNAERAILSLFNKPGISIEEESRASMNGRSQSTIDEVSLMFPHIDRDIIITTLEKRDFDMNLSISDLLRYQN